MNFTTVLLAITAAFAATTTDAALRSATTTVIIPAKCPSGKFWELGAIACRGPKYAGECYNPATAKFQNGCAPGFTCSNNKCVVIPPKAFPTDVCYLKCAESDHYCENGTGFCRGPKYVGECFNPATGHFQNGCAKDYKCANNLCVKSAA